jgi:uncharacterized iron-regulated protein
MADHLAKALNTDLQQGAVLIAGSALVRRDRGVPVWLKGATTLIIAYFALPNSAEQTTRQAIVEAAKSFAANDTADYVSARP